ncbi:MAG: TMEM14 family protein [Synechococcales bacterium]|nr:TMEM14 family protein [Synechococcales bacterium]
MGILGIIAAIAYGILALAGGIWGYTRARSKPSLISGISSGLLLILGGLLAAAGIGWGQWLAVAVTALLIIVFAIRLAKTRKIMPAGVMIVAGGLALVMMLQAG